MTQRGAQKTPYTLLDGVLRLDEDGDLFNRLLGLVTSNLTRPMDSCRPERPFRARDHFQEPVRLYPSDAVECTDASWLVETSVEKNAQVELLRLLKLWGDHQNRQDTDWSTTRIRQIEIPENATKRIEELLENPEYLNGAQELMLDQAQSGKRRMLGVIAGFITCSNMAFNKERDRTRGMGVSTELVPEQVTAVSGTNIHAQASLQKVHHGKISGTYNGEVVVACYYLAIHENNFERTVHNTPLLSIFSNLFNRWSWAPEQSLVVSKKPLEFYIRPGEYLKGNMGRPLGRPPVEGSEDLESHGEPSENARPN
ncbi:hypothetical protein ACLX1H_008037 [Fusarium chlamydosporum]